MMQAVSSSQFLQEFTLLADWINDTGDGFVVQRANSKNIVVMSMASYNDLQKELYQKKQTT